MSRSSVVSIARYKKPLESVRKAVDLSDGLSGLSTGARVFIKPNIVFWTRAVSFPKWGLITTSRVVEDMIIILKERGIDDITVGEGTVVLDPKDRETAAHAFEALGYGALKKRYNIKYINIFDRPFENVDLGEGVELNFNADFLNSDFIVNIPVMKTHAQTVVSLGIKNLKGMIDIKSRKMCHSPDPEKDLDFMIARLPTRLPPSFTILDGIYTNERGPSFDGRIRRSNILVGSADILSADMVGARVLGHAPDKVPHLAYMAQDRGRPLDLSDIDVVGERIEDIWSFHEYKFKYSDDGALPVPLAKMGIKGLSFREYDNTICTYCASIPGIALMAIAKAWKGEPWNDVEVLTGKVMRPTPGKKKTILLGKCMYQANRDNPDIQEMLAVKGCPPSPKGFLKALQQAGIEVDPSIFEDFDMVPGAFMKKYVGKPEFDDSFFRVS